MNDDYQTIKPRTARDYESRLLRVLVYIDDHLDENMKLEDLAAIACFSPFHFHRIFRGMIGETLAGYLRRHRLERAAERLASGRMSVTEVGIGALFENSESFSRAFKAHFGVTPSRYRRSGSVHMTRQALRAAMQEQLNHQSKTLSRYFESKGRRSMFDVKIQSFPAIRQAYIRHVGSYFEVGPVFAQAKQAAGQQNLFGPDTLTLSLYHDDPNTVEASALRADIGFSIAEGTAVKAPLSVQTIEGGDYAVGVLKGPFDGLQAAYDWLYGQWLPQSGREASDKPSLEVYLTRPDQTKPEDYLTEIRIPLL